MSLILPIEDICKKYLSGVNTVELAKEYKCSYSTIRNRLISNGIKIRSKSEVHIGQNMEKDHHAYIILPIEDICKKYLNGMNIKELAEKYNCSRSTIRNRLINKIKIRHEIDLPIEEICKKYLNGMNIKELTEKYNCSQSTIIKRLISNGIKIKSNHEVKTKKLPIKEICRKYLNGINTVELAKEYKCSSSIITRRLISNGIKIRSNVEVQLGKKISEEARQHISAAHQGISYDEWESFAKDQLYCPLFNEKCRESNREKYNRRCFLCGLPESENITKNSKIRKLSVHHVDMDKGQGCKDKKWKLVPICMSWHSKVHNELWESRIIWLLDNVWNNKK